MAVQAIHVAAKFALADLVASSPKSIKELADTTDNAWLVAGQALAAVHVSPLRPVFAVANKIRYNTGSY
jgi:hypothetical protein